MYELLCRQLPATPQPTVPVWAGDSAPGDVTPKKPEPEIDTPRQRLLDPTAENDTSRFLLHENGVATMTYVPRVPEPLLRWTVAISLSPADWTPSSDCELVHAAKRLFQQIQSAVDQLTLDTGEQTDSSALTTVGQLVSLAYTLRNVTDLYCLTYCNGVYII